MADSTIKNKMDFFQVSYNMTYLADSTSPLGYYGSKNIQADVLAHGYPVNALANNVSAYPPIITFFLYSNEWHIGVYSNSNTGNNVVITYLK